MKKSLFAAAVVALALVSCNKKTEEAPAAVDSAAAAVEEAAAAVDSAAGVVADSAAVKAEEGKEAVKK